MVWSNSGYIARTMAGWLEIRLMTHMSAHKDLKDLELAVLSGGWFKPQRASAVG